MASPGREEEGERERRAAMASPGREEDKRREREKDGDDIAGN